MQPQEQAAVEKTTDWKVLIVEDSATFRVLYDGFLSNAGYQTKLVSSGEEALQLLDVEEIDIILMDVSMPGLSGFETAKIIRESFPDKWIPIIFISGHDNDEDYQSAIDSGGDDYITKPVKEAVLLTKLQAVTNILNMQRGLYLAHEELAEKNKTDALTGLFSRRYLLDEAETAWKMMHRLNHSIAVLMVDIDSFKTYNDHYGHAGGDTCLKNVANVLAKSFPRETDIVGRLGGEEFLVVLSNTDTIEATKLAENFRKNLEEKAFPHEKAERGIVTASIGCAACHKLGRHNLDELISHADELLYRAKEEGRNCVVWDDYPTSHILIKESEELTKPEEVEKVGEDRSQFSIKHWAAVIVAIFAATMIGRYVASDLSIGDDKYSDIDAVLAEQGLLEEEPSASIETTPIEPEPVIETLPQTLESEVVIEEELATDVAAFVSQDSEEVVAEFVAEPQSEPEVIAEEIATAVDVPSVAEEEIAATEVYEIPEPVITPTELVNTAVEGWLDGWTSQTESYFDYYHPSFTDSRGTPFDQWKPKRLPKITGPQFINVTIEDLVITELNADEMQAVFIQNYSNGRLSDRGEKTLLFQQTDVGDWRITRETFKAL